LRAFGSQRNKTKTATTEEIKDSEQVAGEPMTTVMESSTPVVNKWTVSWAEVASRGKSWDQSTLFTKSKLLIELIQFVILDRAVQTGRHQERC
jgi:predicted acyl esterase